MRKWVATILVLVFISIALGSQTFAAGNSDSYTNAAEKLVYKYVTKLQNSDYENTVIRTKLANLKSQYLKKTKLRSYRGATKKRIDAIIGRIDYHIVQVQADIDEEKNDPLSDDADTETTTPTS
jgi:flagellin-like hook-associated protein FlgL